MCSGEASHDGIDASGYKQLTAGFFVLCAGSGQLGGVLHLADVVGGGSEENGLRVDAQIEVACSDPFEELPCNVVDCSQMGDQAWRSVKVVKQFGCFDWQWTQRGLAGVLEGDRQYSRGRHRDRVAVAPMGGLVSEDGRWSLPAIW